MSSKDKSEVFNRFVAVTNLVLDTAFDIGQALSEGKLIHPESEVALRLISLLEAGCDANKKWRDAENGNKVQGQ
jgi:hypothetical protein